MSNTIHYPVWDITGYELFYDDDGIVYAQHSTWGTRVLDNTSIDSPDFGVRRAILKSQKAPLIGLKYPIRDALTLARAVGVRQIVDSTGQVRKISRKTKHSIKSYRIREIYASGEEFVLTLIGHTKRIATDEVPPIGCTYVILMQAPGGDLFIGYSTQPLEGKIRV